MTEMKTKKFTPAKLRKVDPNEKPGPAYDIVYGYWYNCGTADFEQGLAYWIAKNCIEGGIKFNLGDFSKLKKDTSWRAGLDAELLYRDACRRRDKSAAMSIEAYLGRIPWKANGERVSLGSHIKHASAPARIFKVTAINDKEGFIRMKSCILGGYDHKTKGQIPDAEVKLHKMTEEEFWQWGMGVMEIDRHVIGEKLKAEGYAYILGLAKNPHTGEVSKETYDASGIDKVVDDEGNKEEQQA